MQDQLVSQFGSGFFHLREVRVAAFETEYLRQLLLTCKGDVSLAAREARLPRGTLYRLLKKHRLNPADFRGTCPTPASEATGNDA